MSKLIKKLNIATILAIILMLCLVQVPIGFAAETSSSGEVLVFLRDVVSLDLNKCNVTLNLEVTDHPSALYGLEEITGKYTLLSQESKIEVLYRFINKTLTYCLMRVQEGSPQYVKPNFTTMSENAATFLEKYETYVGDPSLEGYRNMLSQIDVTKNATKTINNIKLTSTNSLISSLDWRNSFNGADYTGIIISFRNGSFYAFQDDRSYYKIGGTDVNLSKEDAVALALRYAEDLSWELLNGTKVTDFTRVEDEIGAQLLTQPREPLMLYPYWLVILPLDKMYPGCITQIMFQVWADTGEVITCTPLGQGGDVPMNVSTSTPDGGSTPPSQQDGGSTLSRDSLIAITAATAAVVVAVTIIAFKKKRKNPTS
jgi:hypothetical protein